VITSTIVFALSDDLRAGVIVRGAAQRVSPLRLCLALAHPQLKTRERTDSHCMTNPLCTRPLQSQSWGSTITCCLYSSRRVWWFREMRKPLARRRRTVIRVGTNQDLGVREGVGHELYIAKYLFATSGVLVRSCDCGMR
jgi:hypothetical protein